jgi:hypothetical protein
MDIQFAQGMQQLASDVLSGRSAPSDDSVPFEPPSHKPRPEYLPSPNQIREECRRIRDGWSERDHWKRAGFGNGKPRCELRPTRVNCSSMT